MASGSLFFQKDDSGRDLVWDPRRRAVGHCWMLQNLETLLEGLQAWSSRAFRPQQPPALHRHKKPELLAGPVGFRAVKVPFPDWLLTGQSYWSYWCLVSIPLAECWGRKDLPSREYKDLAPIAVLVGSTVRIECGEKAVGAVPPAPSLHLWDSYPTVVAPVLGYYLKQASWRGFLTCKHWKNENEAPWAAG